MKTIKNIIIVVLTFVTQMVQAQSVDSIKIAEIDSVHPCSPGAIICHVVLGQGSYLALSIS
jgi:hypothetical protein